MHPLAEKTQARFPEAFLSAKEFAGDLSVQIKKEGLVEIKWNHVLDEVKGDESGVTGIRIKHRDTGAATELALQGVFVAIGHKPNTDIFEGQLEMKNGYISTRTGLAGNATATSVPM